MLLERLDTVVHDWVAGNVGDEFAGGLVAVGGHLGGGVRHWLLVEFSWEVAGDVYVKGDNSQLTIELGLDCAFLANLSARVLQVAQAAITHFGLMCCLGSMTVSDSEGSMA